MGHSESHGADPSTSAVVIKVIAREAITRPPTLAEFIQARPIDQFGKRHFHQAIPLH
jgi:hypothetical protein